MKYQVQENCLTIYLPREVDHHNAEEIKAEADAVIDRNHIRYVIFDFDRTDFMDSSGIGVIMGRYKTISLIGGEVWAVHTNERIRKAVTNAIIHGYEKRKGKIRIFCRILENQFFMEVSDKGKGILNVEEAMQPMYTTKPEEDRSGMGFAFMEAFMDEVKVKSEPEKGTCVRMKKIIGKGRELWTTQSL